MGVMQHLLGGAMRGGRVSAPSRCHIGFVAFVICDDETERRNVTEDADAWLAERFEENRTHLRAVAYRMLGSLSDADDAVQEAWIRLGRADADGIENLGGWLTTVVARVCVDMLRARTLRSEEPLDTRVPDPIVSRQDRVDPDHEALLGESVGLALLVVLDTLAPAERLAFVLHDMFAVPFDQIATILGRSATSTRQLASRARRRVQGAAVPDTDLARQREVVDAFFAAARDGDFDGLVAVLDPDIVLRSDGGAARPAASVVVRGASSVAAQALMFARLFPFVRPALINATPGVVVAPRGRPFSIMAFTVRHGRIVEIDVLADPERLRHLDLAAVEN
jgi:RNA polymerase sigma factor (sigma-70 family)